ncbi:MAG: Prolipoprotein diacylglyceryl transferase [Candidatus Dichloromethanomonas elyunquensis]|nr:MAG: Prolipoprotein diacylglyceryl transferase [Candidatus Dichloromethanomonas elyunquensis]
MYQYWFFIGNFPIRAYGTMVALAFVLGVGVTVYFAKVERKEEYIADILDLSPFLLLGGLAGARFWQVFFFDWQYYRQYPEEIVAVWHGGLSIQGGIVGALIVGIIYLKVKRIPFWPLADLCAPGLILAQSIGRNANLLNGDAFGGPTGGNFGILYPEGTIARQTFGNQPLWPAEVWEGQIDVVIFAILLVLRLRQWIPGYTFLFYAVLYNCSRLFLEYLRGDSPRFLFGWSAAQWSSTVSILIALGFMLFLYQKNRSRPVSNRPAEDGSSPSVDDE